MRIRVVREGVYTWSENEPSQALTGSGGSAFASRPAHVVGSMIPVMTQPINYQNRARIAPAPRFELRRR